MSLCRQIEADLYCQDIPEDGRCGILNGTANWHMSVTVLRNSISKSHYFKIFSQMYKVYRFFLQIKLERRFMFYIEDQIGLNSVFCSDLNIICHSHVTLTYKFACLSLNKYHMK